MIALLTKNDFGVTLDTMKRVLFWAFILICARSFYETAQGRDSDTLLTRDQQNEVNDIERRRRIQQFEAMEKADEVEEEATRNSMHFHLANAKILQQELVGVFSGEYFAYDRTLHDYVARNVVLIGRQISDHGSKSIKAILLVNGPKSESSPKQKWSSDEIERLFHKEAPGYSPIQFKDVGAIFSKSGELEYTIHKYYGGKDLYVEIVGANQNSKPRDIAHLSPIHQ